MFRSFRCSFWALSSCFLLLSACSTSVNLKIKRAPELNLPGVKTLKIEKFKFSGDLNLDLMDNSGGLLGALVDVGVGAGANKLAENKYPALQADQIQGIKNALFNNGFYQVTDGENFDASITGTVFYEISDEGESKESKNKDGKVTTWYEMTRSASAKINFSVQDKTGTLLGTSQIQVRGKKVTKADNKKEARNKNIPWEKLLRETLAKSSDPLVNKIAPYFVVERRTFAKGKHPGLKIGNKSAKQGDWPGAAESWKQAQESSNDKDRAAALYNMAIYDEVEGNLEGALAKYEEATSLTGGKYGKEVARTRGRIEEAEKLKQTEELREGKEAQ